MAAKAWKKSDRRIGEGERGAKGDSVTVLEEIMTLITHDWKWEKHYLISPVTSVAFLGADLIISGNGPFLDIHSVTKGVLLINECLLTRSRIHGIRVEQKYGKLVVIFGQKVIRVIRLQESAAKTGCYSVKAATDIETFPDLIWDAHWLYNEEALPKYITIATAHNAVWCWNWESNTKQLIAQCEEHCILYSAQFFGSNMNDLFLASGTVFNQILLWKVHGKKDEQNKTPVLQRLAGHEGVIFSLNFNKAGTLLSSVSDDRSIRLWKIANLRSLETSGHVDPFLVVYGHAARVWDAKLLETCFVSIGEDLVCNVWSYDGKIVTTHRGHTGRNIWSLAVNQSEDLIATGGGDGSIRLWPLPSSEQSSRTMAREACLPFLDNTASGSMETNKKDYPRYVSLLDQSNLLVMTNEGCLYKYSWLKKDDLSGKQAASCTCSNTESLTVEDQWKLLLKDTNYSSYSVLALSPCHNIIAFGNLQGNIKLQDTGFNHPCVEFAAHSGKVHNLLWSSQNSPQYLFSCGPEGQITWWNIRYVNTVPVFIVSPLRLFILPPSKQRWASAIEIFPKPLTKQSSDNESLTAESMLLVCGDRKGSLHLFDPINSTSSSDKPITPSHSLPLLHGKAGVSYLCLHNNIIYSSGRDGGYRQLRVHNDTLEVIDTKKVFKSFDWLERLIFTANGLLLIAGFHAAYFVLWSVERNEILWRVKCGGAHRVWDLALKQSDVSISGAVLSFIKDSMIYTHEITFPNEVKKAVLKPGFHGREATCLCRIDSLVTRKGEICDVFATASEDTNIKLMISNRSSGVTSSFFTAHGHISSVRALSVTKRPLSQLQPSAGNGNTTSHLLFSGGGRASLKCWRLNLSLLDVDTDGCHGDMMTCSPMVYLGEYSFSFSNHRRRRRKQYLESLSEIRFMSLTSLNAAEVIGHSSSQDLMDRCQSLYFVMAACSDGFVRVFAFYEQQNKFFLLAQSQYLRRCVLTLSHVFDFHVGERPLVMMFAGDTAGRISCWNVTALLLRHIWECCTSIDEQVEKFRKALENESVIEYNLGGLDVDEEKVRNISSEKNTFEAVDLSENSDTSQTNFESVTPSLSEESVTSDRLKAVENVEQNGNVPSGKRNKVGLKGDNLTNFEADVNVSSQMSNSAREEQRTGKKDSKKLANIEPSTEDEVSGAGTKENAVVNVACVAAPNQPSVTQLQDNPRLNLKFKEQSDFSCLPLVRTFLPHPIHVFKCHQSGVNALSLTNIKGEYLLVSGGDDSALYAVQFSLEVDSKDVTKVHVIREISEPQAHTSSVTGVKALRNGLVISSSVDQRLALWALVKEDQVSPPVFVFRQLTAEIVDIADVQDLEVWGERDNCAVAGVCGVGLQTFCLVGKE